ncbi:MAG: DNA repair exonuclease [Myxococcales bacterium]|nr:DNA repair exonuclease [Myxococcales bacterium]
MSFRFVHTADVHLDSPLRSLALRDERLADLVASATRTAFERTVELCLDEAVDALFIVGDLYDGDQTSMKTAVFLAEQLRRLDRAGIEVFIARGNHDAASRVTRELSLPERVRVFSGRGGAFELKTKSGLEVRIHGISFREPHAPESLLPKFKAKVPGALNVGLLHTSLAGADGHDDYAPCKLSELLEHGFDYWALGHVHRRAVHSEAPAVVMPGMPQGRDINEDGEKSVTLASIAEDGRVTLEARGTSVAQFERVQVELAGLDDYEAVLVAIRRALERAREAATSEHLIARLQLSGESALGFRLRADADRLLEEARLLAADIGACWIETLELALSAPSQGERPVGANPLLQLGALIEARLLTSEAFRDEARAIVQQLRTNLPAEGRKFLSQDEAAHEAQIDSLIREGSQEVLARLEARRLEEG